MGVTVSCDLNYRKNLWKWGKKASEVMPEAATGAIQDHACNCGIYSNIPLIKIQLISI
jgi:sugar/nucleoside kinase (ribokinase family)